MLVSQVPRAPRRRPSLANLEVTSPSFAGPSGTARGARQEGEWCRDRRDALPLPSAGRKGVWVPHCPPWVLLPLTPFSSCTRETVGHQESWERRVRR